MFKANFTLNLTVLDVACCAFFTRYKQIER